MEDCTVEGFEGWTIKIGDGDETRIHHVWPKEGLEFADGLLEEYQGEEAGGLFKRNTLTTHRRE